MDCLPSFAESARLTIRQWTDDDAAVMEAAIEASLGHLRPWMPWAAEHPASRQDQLARIRRWRTERERGSDSVFGLFRDGVVVGAAGLHRRFGPGAVEIGYWIHVDHIRRGYATEAAGALTAAAFAVPHIERVEIHTDKANIASAGVPRRLGFVLAGESPDEVEAPGEMGIECRWVMTRSAWLRY